MKEEYIEAIETTWANMETHGLDVTISFYDRLFELVPEVRSMFDEDISKQAEKLMFTIGFLVSNIGRLDHIVPSIEQLGILHGKAYKVKDEHYQFVTDSLIYTFSRNLEDIWTPAYEEAWRAALDGVAKIMIEAANK